MEPEIAQKVALSGASLLHYDVICDCSVHLIDQDVQDERARSILRPH